MDILDSYELHKKITTDSEMHPGSFNRHASSLIPREIEGLGMWVYLGGLKGGLGKRVTCKLYALKSAARVASSPGPALLCSHSRAGEPGNKATAGVQMKHDADHIWPVAFLVLVLWPLVGFLQISWLPESKSHSAIIRWSQTKKIRMHLQTVHTSNFSCLNIQSMWSLASRFCKGKVHL